MSIKKIEPVRQIQGRLQLPGDKSVSHRAVILGTLAEGETLVTNFLTAADCMNTLAACRQLGASIEQTGTQLRIRGCGRKGLVQPKTVIDCGNSGTGVRLLAGVLAGQPFTAVITGDEQVQRRPMRRVIEPLQQMGASISSQPGFLCPLTIQGARLHSIAYESQVASAQVKSCVLLAGLFAEGETRITLPSASRDHTERMLEYFGARVTRAPQGALAEAHWSTSRQEQVGIVGHPMLTGKPVAVPADISSAAFFMVAAAALPDSVLSLAGIGVNPGRTGVIDILQRMGANITFAQQRLQSGEPVADLEITGGGQLHGHAICGESLIPRLIDELPILAVAAAVAEGETVIEDAAELRVKETDRIHVLVKEFRNIGIEIEERPDGMLIQGGAIRGGSADSHGDHRLAMSLAIAGLLSEEGVEIHNPECINTSFPSFWNCLQQVCA